MELGSSTKMDPHTELIISEIEKRPALWDKKHKSYHYHDIVDNNWQIIAKIVRMPKVPLKRKWKGIRDQFRVELKKIPNSRTDDFEITDEMIEKYTVWPHFKSLLFLRGQMKLRSSNNAGIEYIHTNEYDSSMDNDNVNDPLITTFHVEETVDEKPAIKRPKILPTERKIEPAKLGWGEKKPRIRNDDEAFFDSLLPYFSNMDLKTKMLCRMEIQKVVYNYAFSSSIMEQGGEAISEEQGLALINTPVPQIDQDKKPFNLNEFII